FDFVADVGRAGPHRPGNDCAVSGDGERTIHSQSKELARSPRINLGTYLPDRFLQFVDPSALRCRGANDWGTFQKRPGYQSTDLFLDEIEPRLILGQVAL